MTENHDGKRRLNRNDLLHDLQLLRDMQAINEQSSRMLGLLPRDGLPVPPKRKPQLPRPAVPPRVQLPPSSEDTTMQWKSVAAVAALAAGSALTACGAGSTAAHVDPPAVAVPDASALVQLQTVEAIPPTTEATVAEPATPMESKASEPVRGPAIPATQLRRQILALLESFEKLEDLERDNVERAFGARMKKAPDMREGYEYDGVTSEGWGYGILVAKLNRLDEPPTITIGLDHGVEPWTDQKPTYCTLEFEPLAKELVAMGYERTEKMLRLKGNQWWGFRRENTQSRTVIGAMVYVYRIPDNESGRYCVKSISFGGDPLDD